MIHSRARSLRKLAEDTPALGSIHSAHKRARMLCARVTVRLDLQRIGGTPTHGVFGIGHRIEADDPFVPLPDGIVVLGLARKQRHAVPPLSTRDFRRDMSLGVPGLHRLHILGRPEARGRNSTAPGHEGGGRTVGPPTFYKPKFIDSIGSPGHDALVLVLADALCACPRRFCMSAD